MTSEQMEKAIEFLLDQQARMDAAILTMSGKVGELSDNVNAMVEQANEDRAAIIEANAEIKESLNLLLRVIESNAALTKEAYAIARSSEKRLSLLEGRVDGIENRLDN